MIGRKYASLESIFQDAISSAEQPKIQLSLIIRTCRFIGSHFCCISFNLSIILLPSIFNAGYVDLTDHQVKKTAASTYRNHIKEQGDTFAVKYNPWKPTLCLFSCDTALAAQVATKRKARRRPVHYFGPFFSTWNSYTSNSGKRPQVFSDDLQLKKA